MSVRLATGHEAVTMSEEWMDENPGTRKLFNSGMVKIMPEGWLYSGRAPYFLDKLQTFQFRADDVLVVTHSKCGTTWMQEILWTMKCNPDLNNAGASESLLTRSPDISQDMTDDGKALPDMKQDMFGEKLKSLVGPGQLAEEGQKEVAEKDGVHMAILNAMPSPRIIKSHYPIALFPPDILDKTKVVYVARNPKDTVVSFYHFCRVLKVYNYQGTFDAFVREFMTENLTYGPFMAHVKDAWARRQHPNLLIVFYEDLQTDLMNQLRRVDNFIGTNLTQEQLQNVARQTTFSSMKARDEPLNKESFNSDLLKNSGGYIRKGVSGDWRNHFSPELNQEMDRWIEAHVAGTGLNFKWGS